MILFIMIFVFTPSVIGILLKNKLLRKELCKQDLPIFLVYVLISNIISVLIIHLFKGFDLNLFYHLGENTVFAAKYSLLLIVVNIFIGHMNSIFSKYFDIYLEGSNEKDNN